MFTLSPTQLAAMRLTAEQSMQSHVSLYTVDVSRDEWGAETYISGTITSVKCLLAGITGRDEEIVDRLRTEGLIKKHTAKLLVPYGTAISTDQYALISGGNEWSIAWTNDEITDTFQLYTKTIITRNDEQTNYKDKIANNG